MLTATTVHYNTLITAPDGTEDLLPCGARSSATIVANDPHQVTCQGCKTALSVWALCKLVEMKSPVEAAAVAAVEAMVREASSPFLDQQLKVLSDIRSGRWGQPR